MVAGMVGGMLVSGMLVKRLGRHLLHIGILFIAVGTTTLALMLTGVHNASTWDLVPGLLLPARESAPCSVSSSSSSSPR
jgi:hypothetical protein